MAEVAKCPRCEETFDRPRRMSVTPGDSGCLFVGEGEGAVHRCATLDKSEELELLRFAQRISEIPDL